MSKYNDPNNRFSALVDDEDENLEDSQDNNEIQEDDDEMPDLIEIDEVVVEGMSEENVIDENGFDVQEILGEIDSKKPYSDDTIDYLLEKEVSEEADLGWIGLSAKENSKELAAYITKFNENSNAKKLVLPIRTEDGRATSLILTKNDDGITTAAYVDLRGTEPKPAPSLLQTGLNWMFGAAKDTAPKTTEIGSLPIHIRNILLTTSRITPKDITFTTNKIQQPTDSVGESFLIEVVKNLVSGQMTITDNRLHEGRDLGDFSQEMSKKAEKLSRLKDAKQIVSNNPDLHSRRLDKSSDDIYGIPDNHQGPSLISLLSAATVGALSASGSNQLGTSSESQSSSALSLRGSRNNAIAPLDIPRPKSFAPSFSPTHSPTTLTPSSHPSVQPSGQPSAQPTTQPSDKPSAQPNERPSSQPSVQPSNKPSGQPSIQPSSQSSSQPTGKPSSTPSKIQPSAQPTAHPTSQPTTQPSIQPSAQPSARPSSRPSLQPSTQPSNKPSGRPTSQPSSHPSIKPSGRPSSQTSNYLSARPSNQATNTPSTQPSRKPSEEPTAQPSSQPSEEPTAQPSSQPSEEPTAQPSNQPTGTPTQPSSQPTGTPTQPSSQPTGVPTQPSSQPSTQPSGRPSTTTSTPSTSNIVAASTFSGEVIATSAIATTETLAAVGSGVTTQATGIANLGLVGATEAALVNSGVTSLTALTLASVGLTTLGGGLVGGVIGGIMDAANAGENRRRLTTEGDTSVKGTENDPNAEKSYAASGVEIGALAGAAANVFSAVSRYGLTPESHIAPLVALILTQKDETFENAGDYNGADYLEKINHSLEHVSHFHAFSSSADKLKLGQALEFAFEHIMAPQAGGEYDDISPKDFIAQFKNRDTPLETLRVNFAEILAGRGGMFSDAFFTTNEPNLANLTDTRRKNLTKSYLNGSPAILAQAIENCLKLQDKHVIPVAAFSHERNLLVNAHNLIDHYHEMDEVTFVVNPGAKPTAADLNPRATLYAGYDRRAQQLTGNTNKNRTPG